MLKYYLSLYFNIMLFTPYKHDLQVGISIKHFEGCFGKSKRDSENNIEYWQLKIDDKVVFLYEWDGVLYMNLNSSESVTNDDIKKVCMGRMCNRIANYIDSDLRPDRGTIECLHRLLYVVQKAKGKVDQGVPNLDPVIHKENVTFADLNTHLEDSDYVLIHDFMRKYSVDNQQFFEPQESILRLFVSKGLLTYAWDMNGVRVDLSLFTMSLSNFSAGKVRLSDSAKFEDIQNKRLKDSGDKSDLTLVSNDKHMIIATTSKNFADYSGKGRSFDLNKITNDFNSLYSMNAIQLQTLVVVRDKRELEKAMVRMTFSSTQSKLLLQNSLFLDWDDLNSAYRRFKQRDELTLDTHVERLMCKYIDDAKRRVLDAKYSNFRNFTDVELMERYNPTPDVTFVEIDVPKNSDSILEKIVLGEQRTTGSIQTQTVHIRLRNKFGHNLRDMFSAKNVRSITRGEVARCEKSGLYIVDRKFDNHATTDATELGDTTYFLFVNESPLEIQRIFNTFRDKNGRKLEQNMSSYIRIKCDIQEDQIILSEQGID
jgi:hypothetical protein